MGREGEGEGGSYDKERERIGEEEEGRTEAHHNWSNGPRNANENKCS